MTEHAPLRSTTHGEIPPAVCKVEAAALAPSDAMLEDGETFVIGQSAAWVYASRSTHEPKESSAGR